MVLGNIPLWNSASNKNIAQYMGFLNAELCTLRTLEACNYVSCGDQDYCELINEYYDKIISCMQSASYSTIP